MTAGTIDGGDHHHHHKGDDLLAAPDSGAGDRRRPPMVSRFLGLTPARTTPAPLAWRGVSPRWLPSTWAGTALSTTGAENRLKRPVFLSGRRHGFERPWGCSAPSSPPVAAARGALECRGRAGAWCAMAAHPRSYTRERPRGEKAPCLGPEQRDGGLLGNGGPGAPPLAALCRLLSNIVTCLGQTQRLG